MGTSSYADAKIRYAQYRDPRSVDELTEANVRSIAALEREAKRECSGLTRAVHALTRFCGTIGFAFLHVVLFAAWIVANTLPGWKHIDPFPYTLLTLIVSLEAILLSTFILISQNEEQRLADRRNALDLQINLLTEQENTKMLRVLERIAHKLQVDLGDEATLAALEQATRPEKLAQQIDRINAAR